MKKKASASKASRAAKMSKSLTKMTKKAAAPTPKKLTMSLGVSDGFRTYVLDQLADVGDVTARSMFGGIGLYSGDLFFGLIARDVLYLKVDDRTRGDYDAAGSTPFQPYDDGRMSMTYFSVPIGVLEDAETLTHWARRAVDAATRAGKTTTSRSKRDTSR